MKQLDSVVSQWYMNFTGCLSKWEIFLVQFRRRKLPFCPINGSLIQIVGMVGSGSLPPGVVDAKVLSFYVCQGERTVVTA